MAAIVVRVSGESGHSESPSEFNPCLAVVKGLAPFTDLSCRLSVCPLFFHVKPFPQKLEGELQAVGCLNV